MKPEILQAIQSLILTDNTILPDQRKRILNACKNVPEKPIKRKLITARQAAEIMDCHVRTLHRYIQKGCITVVRFSPRKHRYYLDEIETFAQNGIRDIGNEVIGDRSNDDH